MATVRDDPSRPQSLLSEGEGESNSPTGNPHPGGELCIASRQSFGTLQTRSCINLWRISIRKSHSVSCMQPPAILNQHLGENSQGEVILMGMTRRLPFQEGRVGSPQDNHPHLQPQHDQMEGGFLRDHLLNPQSLLHKMWMWGT